MFVVVVGGGGAYSLTQYLSWLTKGVLQLEPWCEVSSWVQSRWTATSFCKPKEQSKAVIIRINMRLRNRSSVNVMFMRRWNVETTALVLFLSIVIQEAWFSLILRDSPKHYFAKLQDRINCFLLLKRKNSEYFNKIIWPRLVAYEQKRNQSSRSFTALKNF